MMTERRPSPEGVLQAAKRISKHVSATPLLPFEWAGRTVWAKAECLQKGGSFKIRGATNRLLQLNADERERGVVAFSSGNHAQGVALAARRLGIAATIVMPSDAPQVKRRATLAAGGRIIDYDRRSESREAIATEFAQATGATVVPSFDDVDIIEGQGTVGIEIAEQLRAFAGAAPDRVLVPCGGGGLCAGIALALGDSEITPAEPQGWDDMARSLEGGERVSVADDAPPTRCDALQTTMVSPLTFDVLHGRGARGLAVSEREVEAAIAFAATALRLVVEPGGAVALAALLSGRAGPVRDRDVVVISGGNVDPRVFAQIIEAQATELAR